MKGGSATKVILDAIFLPALQSVIAEVRTHMPATHAPLSLSLGLSLCDIFNTPHQRQRAQQPTPQRVSTTDAGVHDTLPTQHRLPT